MEKLYDYLFHYNHYEELWYAFKRENKEKYFNGQLTSDDYIKNKDVMTLIKFIIST